MTEMGAVVPRDVFSMLSKKLFALTVVAGGFGAAVASVLAVLVVVQLTQGHFPRNRPGIRFDSERWKGSVDDRLPMLEDLKRNHLKVGMSEPEIVALLGMPDRRINLSKSGRKPSNAFESICFELPIDGQFDTHQLVIVLDQSGKMIELSEFEN